MPKVYITQRQRDLEGITRLIKKQCAAEGKSGAQLAKELHIPHQTFNYRVVKGTITLVDFIELCRHLNFELHDIQKLIRIGG